MSKSGGVIAILFGLASLGTGIGVGVSMEEGLATKGWPTTTGTVVSVDIESRTGSQDGRTYTRYAPRVIYRYTVGDQTYDGGRFAIFRRQFDDRASVERMIAERGFSEGATVEVYYDPRRPHHSVLVPGVGVTAPVMALIATVLGLGAIVIGVLMYRNAKEYKPVKLTRLGPFDPSVFDDPIAERLDWSFERFQMQASYRTRGLVRVSPERLEVRPTAGGRSLHWGAWGIALAMLTALIIVAIVEARSSEFTVEDDLYTALPVCAGMLGVIGLVLWLLTGKPVVLDREAGLMWVGSRPPRDDETGVRDRSRVRPLDQVHAVQIIPQHSRSHANHDGPDAIRHGMNTIRLNLVFHDGTVRTLTNQPGLGPAREDAAVIAEFLGCPVWDRTLYT